MDQAAIITALDAYTNAVNAYGKTAWLALVLRSSTGADADAARAIREAGKNAEDDADDTDPDVADALARLAKALK